MNNLSVVISTYSIDRYKYVINCIDSIKKQTYKPKEILLVLDPDTRLFNFYKKKLQKCVKLFTSKGFGLSNARNTGITKSNGEIIAFIDDDAVASENWLENMMKNYVDKNVMGVGGYIEPKWDNDKPVWFPPELYWIIGCSYKGLPEKISLIRNPLGCNMSFRRNAFLRAGYFRTCLGRTKKNYLGDEETELSIRVLNKISKSKIIYDPSAIVYHHIPNNKLKFTYILKRAYYEGISKSMITQKNYLYNEKKYFINLLIKVIPSKLSKLYRFENVVQSPVLLLSIFATSIGFLMGHLNL